MYQIRSPFTFRSASLVIAFMAVFATGAFSQSLLVNEMAELDLAYIPALALTNQGNVDAARTALSRFQKQWNLFLVSSGNAFPGDAAWEKGIDSIRKIVDVAAARAAEGNLPAIHEALEGVRTTFLELREKRGIYYFLDSYTRYHTEMEEATAILANKKPADLTRADLDFVVTMMPRLKSAWTEATAAPLEPSLFHFDEAKLAKIRSATVNVQKSIDTLEIALSGTDRDRQYVALNALKPAFTGAFLLFGRF